MSATPRPTGSWPLPPSPVRTERLLLRCWEPEDAPLLKAAVDLSLDHLQRWMPWAMQEPSDLSVVEQRLLRFRQRFLDGDDFVYGIFDAGESEVLGGTGLHTRRGPHALEIGYWIRADRVRQGFATEAARAMTRIAFDAMGATRIEIRCDPDNIASAAVPRRLGYVLRETIAGDTITPMRTPRDSLVWEMSRASL